MAEVRAGVDEVTGNKVAIKLLHRGLIEDAGQQERFRREGLVMAGLCHPNIVRVHAYGISTCEQPFIIQDFVDGELLLDVMKAGPFRAGECLQVVEQMASALEYCHEAGVIHRDLKPDNVFLVGEFGGDCVVKVTDFGVAKLVGQPSITVDGMVYGTPGYMAPEYIIGAEPNAQTDVYSMGVILYELVTGSVPFTSRRPTQLMQDHVQRPPPALRESCPDIHDGLEAFVLRCLAKQPGERPQGVAAVAREWRQLVEQGA